MRWPWTRPPTFRPVTPEELGPPPPGPDGDDVRLLLKLSVDLERLDADPSENKDAVAAALSVSAALLSRLGRDDRALAYLNETIARYRRDRSVVLREYVMSALFNSAVILDGRGDEELSVRRYREVVERQDGGRGGADDWAARALVNLGSSLLVLGETRAAITALSDVVTRYDHDPQHRADVADALYNLGGEYSLMRMTDQAVASFDQVIRRWADDPDPRLRGRVAAASVNRAIALSRAGRVQDAVASLDETIARYRDDAEPAVVEAVGHARQARSTMSGS